MIVSPIVAEFTSAESYDITGRGTVYYVQNPRDCTDFKWLVGQWVRINGSIMEVQAIERYAFQGTYPAGTPIGLVVRQISPSDSDPNVVAADKPPSESV